MIKKTKGIICLICVFMLLVTSIVPAMADGKSLAFDMEAMGITTGMDASARGEEYVRRDEFAQMVVNMLRQWSPGAWRTRQTVPPGSARSPLFPWLSAPGSRCWPLPPP